MSGWVRGDARCRRGRRAHAPSRGAAGTRSPTRAHRGACAWCCGHRRGGPCPCCRVTCGERRRARATGTREGEGGAAGTHSAHGGSGARETVARCQRHPWPASASGWARRRGAGLGARGGDDEGRGKGEKRARGRALEAARACSRGADPRSVCDNDPSRLSRALRGSRGGGTRAVGAAARGRTHTTPKCARFGRASFGRLCGARHVIARHSRRGWCVRRGLRCHASGPRGPLPREGAGGRAKEDGGRGAGRWAREEDEDEGGWAANAVKRKDSSSASERRPARAAAQRGGTRLCEYACVR